ncbi:MAG: tRNA adenosine(34) deaminase TadA [Desulfobacterales bacterium]|nr:tRNA adenosine(34) deaminase TadA [Desulfobacterales bacterium]
MTNSHSYYMDIALEEAKKAGQIGEVPIGAIIIAENGEVVASAYNRTIEQVDPTAHAEILALRQAALSANNYRLLNTSLYVTVEPCLMCMGAIVHARVRQVIYGAKDPKWGAAGSLYNFSEDVRLNHSVKIVQGVREEKCRELMQAFFRAKRA